jgi:cytochrome c oxidase cbb3-type subunit 4
MLSGFVASTLMLLFVAGWIWAWSPKHKREFEAAARLPLEDADEAKPGTQR